MPVTPAAPTTHVTADKVVVTWTEPSARGTPITGYKIYIRKSDLTYAQEPISCDASASLALTCSIPLSTLTATPFSLVNGQSVKAKLIAINLYGDSGLSVSGSGAIMV